MAAIFRRSSHPNAILGAARPINLGSPTELRAFRQYSSARVWQKAAWDFYDQVGEIKFAVNWVGWMISKLRLYPAVITDPTKDPQMIDNPAAVDALYRLSKIWGSHSELLRMWAINWSVAGECYLVGLDRGADGESWEIKSVDEIVVHPTGGFGMRVGEDPNNIRRLDPDKDFLLRLWVNHPRFSSMPDSPLRGVLDSAEEVVWLSRLVRSIAANRIALAGFIKVPSEMTFPGTSPSPDEPDGDPFIRKLIEIGTAALEHSGSAAEIFPAVVRAPKDLLDAFGHEPIERPFDAQIDVRTERALRRLAQGLNVPVEVVLGMEGINHWVAWKISEDGFQNYLEPLATAMVNALTVGYYWPHLKIRNPNPDSPIIWYDASRLITRPDRTADYKDAHDRMAISDRAYRNGMGFSEDDAPDPEELARRVGLKRGSVDPFLTEALLKLLVPDIAVDRPSNQLGPIQEPAPQARHKPPPSVPTETAPNFPSRSHTKPVEMAAVYGQLLGAAEAAVRRVLERAGARLRTRVQKDRSLLSSIASVPDYKVPSELGPDRVKSLGISEDYLLNGPLGCLQEQFNSICDNQKLPNDVRHQVWEKLRKQISDVCRVSLYSSSKSLMRTLAPAVEMAVKEIFGEISEYA